MCAMKPNHTPYNLDPEPSNVAPLLVGRCVCGWARPGTFDKHKLIQPGLSQWPMDNGGMGGRPTCSRGSSVQPRCLVADQQLELFYTPQISLSQDCTHTRQGADSPAGTTHPSVLALQAASRGPQDNYGGILVASSN